MSYKPEDYSITITHGEFEGEILYEAAALEFPWLSEYGDTEQEALELIHDAIDITMTILLEKGMEIPKSKQSINK